MLKQQKKLYQKNTNKKKQGSKLTSIEFKANKSAVLILSKVLS